MNVLTLGLVALGILGLLIFRVAQQIVGELKNLRSTLARADAAEADQLEKIQSTLQEIRDELGVSPHRASSSTFGDRVAGISEAIWEMREAQERESRG